MGRKTVGIANHGLHGLHGRRDPRELAGALPGRESS
jgi:hypothetical protein